MDQTKKPIASYLDLEVYQRSYKAMTGVFFKILSKISVYEKYDLTDQLRRSSKAIPRLIAEGYAKRHQKYGFQKYLVDSMAEANETHVSLCQCRDLYGIACDELIEQYAIIGKQLYRLSAAWKNFKEK